jgi:hypothetical protein
MTVYFLRKRLVSKHVENVMSKLLAAVQEYDAVKSGRQLLKAAKRGDLNHTLIRIYMQVNFSIQPGSTITAEGTRVTVNAY